MEQLKDVTLLIGGYDPYEPLWENFFTLKDKYLTFTCDTLFATQHKTKEIPGVTFYPTGEIVWSNRMIEAINEINTKYTFFILDDYFITEELSAEEMRLHLDFMEQYNANKIMLEYKCKGLTLIDPFPYKDRTVYRLSPRSEYLTSMQPSIWLTSYLKECMKPGWNAWEFEINGTKLRNHETDTYLMLRDKKPYWNAVVKGKKVLDGWQQLKDIENLKEFNI